jgi:hypothetical protein
MKRLAFHSGRGNAFPAQKHAFGPVGGIAGGPMVAPPNPAVKAPTPPSASPSAGGGGLQGLMAEATQAAGG